MSYYRAYIIGRDGHFVDAINLDCDHDAAAIECAKRLIIGHDVELWQQERMVIKIRSDDPK